MQILLVFPPLLNLQGAIAPPLGILSIAAVLEEQGRTVEVLDFVYLLSRGDLLPSPRIYEQAAALILERQPDLIGFSTQCASYPSSIQVARRIKNERPDSTVVFGGMNASFLARETLEAFPEVDIVCGGEGEAVFPLLVQALEQGAPLDQVGGIAYRAGGSVHVNADPGAISDLDRLPLPAYHLVPTLAEYARCNEGFGMAEALVEAGRGCPYSCMFCSICNFFGQKARTFSPERVVEEVQWLVSMGAQSIYFTFDVLSLERPFVESLCRLLGEREVSVHWVARSRLDLVDEALIDTMVAAGCREMFFGLESGSERILGALRGKNIGETKIIEYARQSGVSVSLSFIIGHPQETEEDLDQTLWCCLEYAAREVMGVPLLLCTLPGTDLYR